MEEIQFDDIAALQKHVSEEYGDFCEPVEVTQEMVNQFAEVTGDHQWIHVDPERAAECGAIPRTHAPPDKAAFQRPEFVADR